MESGKACVELIIGNSNEKIRGVRFWKGNETMVGYDNGSKFKKIFKSLNSNLNIDLYIWNNTIFIIDKVTIKIESEQIFNF